MLGLLTGVQTFLTGLTLEASPGGDTRLEDWRGYYIKSGLDVEE